MKTSNIYKVAAAALLTAAVITACHDDLGENRTYVFGDGRMAFAIGTQDNWTPETRAAHNSVTILKPEQVEGAEPLVVIVNDALTGDSVVTAEESVTRGRRYTNDDDENNAGTKWDGFKEGDELYEDEAYDKNHYMHPNFMLLGMTYEDELLSDYYSDADLWSSLSSGPTQQYTVIERPSIATRSEGEHYETWPWTEEENEGVLQAQWPESGNVMLVACAPVFTDGKSTFNVPVSESDKRPYVEYVVPEESYMQQDIMVAKCNITHDQITTFQQGMMNNPANDPIQLNFQHICTAVKFKIAGPLTGDPEGTPNTIITKITMKNVVNKGRYQLNSEPTKWPDDKFEAAGEWFLESDSKGDVYRTFTDEEGQWTDTNKQTTEHMLTTDEDVFLMIPQSFTTSDPLKVLITYKEGIDGNEVTIGVDIEHEWREGHTVIYTIAKAGAVTVHDPTFNVTVVKDNGTEFVPAVGDTSYPYNTIYTGTDDIAFKVESYQKIEIAGNPDPLYVDIPWEITKTQLKDGNGAVSNTYIEKDNLLPHMILMDEKNAEDITFERGSTGEEVTAPAGKLQKTWGNGGYPADALQKFTVRRSDKRGSTDSDAMNVVLSHSTIGTEDEPQDLSKLTLGGEPMENQSTANCYVVSAPGYYSIPLVYGNALMNGTDNTTAYKSSNFVISQTSHSLGNIGTNPTYSFIDGRGNSITSPWITFSGNPESFVLWQTSPDIVTDLEVTQHADNHYYLDFAITRENINLGNSVVAVSDNDGILWSWHIWINDYNEVNNAIEGTVTETIGDQTQNFNYAFMEVNLGWTDGYTETFQDSVCTFTFQQLYDSEKPAFDHQERTVNVKRNFGTKETAGTAGTYYQSGRKDPFPSVSVSLTADDDISVGDKTIYGVKRGEDMLFPPAGKQFLYNCHENYAVTVSNSNVSMQDGILNPNLLYLPTTGTNWFTTNGYYDNLWSMVPYLMDEMNEDEDGTPTNVHAQVYKTIYDPCPIGYCVPNPGAFRGFYKKQNHSYKPNFFLDQDQYIYIYGMGNTTGYWLLTWHDLGGAVPAPGNLTPNNIDLTNGQFFILEEIFSSAPCYTEEAVISYVKSDLKTYGYTSKLGTQSKLIEKEGLFAQAESGVMWKDEAEESTEITYSADPRYKGIVGIVCTNWGNLFLPSAGGRSPRDGGETNLTTDLPNQTPSTRTDPTFNRGGYYATAFTATDDGRNAATFYWIQRNRLRDGLNNQFISSSEIPFFDPYNEIIIDPLDPDHPEKNRWNIWVYRNSDRTDQLAVNVWGNGLQVLNGAGLNMIPRINGDNPNVGVYVYFTKREEPQVYTTDQWARDRTFAMSVRPIKDNRFTTDVGISITNSTDAGKPYRETLSRRRK